MDNKTVFDQVLKEILKGRNDQFSEEQQQQIKLHELRSQLDREHFPSILANDLLRISAKFKDESVVLNISVNKDNYYVCCIKFLRIYGEGTMIIKTASKIVSDLLECRADKSYSF